MGERLKTIDITTFNDVAITWYVDIISKEETTQMDLPDPLTDVKDWVKFRESLFSMLETHVGVNMCHTCTSSVRMEIPPQS